MTHDDGLLAAVEAAMEAGVALLREGRWRGGSKVAKRGPRLCDGGRYTDRRAIRAALETAAPGIGFLGEEEGERVAESGALWVLDPIDGTVNFANGSPRCGISLALVEDGAPTLGVIDLPLLGERYLARAGSGASLNGRPIHVIEKGGLHEAIVGFADFAVGPAAKVENRVHRELMDRLVPRCLRVRVHGSEIVDLAWLAPAVSM